MFDDSKLNWIIVRDEKGNIVLKGRCLYWEINDAGTYIKFEMEVGFSKHYFLYPITRVTLCNM